MAEIQKAAEPKETEKTGNKSDVKADTAAPIVDLAAVQEENADVVAWIRWTGEGSVIDYPILRSTPEEGEDYYLTKNVKKEEATAGSIYMQQIDAADFSDYMTVLYGHNMRDGSMFHGLHSFYDEAFFNTEGNRTFLVQTDRELLTYKVYAAVRFGDVLIPATYDETDPAARTQFLSDVASCADATSHVDSSMTVTEADKLLILSTCVANTHDYRYIVVAVLQKEEPLA